MEGELIIVSVISIFGAVIILLFNQRFWIQKWNMKYKFEKYKLSQRKKNLPAPKSPEPASALGNIASLIPLIKNLTPEQIEMFTSFIGGEPAAGEFEESSGVGGILEFAEKNPELVRSFLEGLGRNLGTQKPLEKNTY